MRKGGIIKILHETDTQAGKSGGGRKGDTVQKEIRMEMAGKKTEEAHAFKLLRRR